jgi:hypothetical protein
MEDLMKKFVSLPALLIYAAAAATACIFIRTKRRKKNYA